MPRRPLVLVNVVAIGLLVATACTPGAQPPASPTTDVDPNGEIRVASLRLAVGDPNLRIANFLTSLTFEGLMTLDPTTLRPIPAAAKENPAVSADGLTYTFALRDGLKYSDGGPLAAKDFSYGFARLCNPTLHSDWAVPAYLIAGCEPWNKMDPKKASAADLAAARGRLGVRASGDKDVVITLTEPAPYFTSLIAVWFGVPVREADVTRAGEAYGADPAALVGNGPFKVIEFKANDTIVFERNDNYRTPAKLKRWTRIVIRDPAQVLAAYRNNELDFYDPIADDLSAIERDADLKSQVVDTGGSCTQAYFFNTQRAPFSDVRVRQAFAKSLDREAYVREIAKLGRAAYSWIRPGGPGHDATDRFQSFDPVGAKELLRSSSFFGRPELATISVVYRTDTPGRKELAEWAQQQWKQNLGLDVRVDPVDARTWNQLSSTVATTPPVVPLASCEDYPDPQNWLTLNFHSSLAYGGYNDPTFDKLVRDADREPEPLKRADLYQQASRLLSQDAPAAWLIWPGRRYLRKPWVKGVTDSPDDNHHGIYRVVDIYVAKRK